MEKANAASWIMAGMTGLIVIASSIVCSVLIAQTIRAKNATKIVDESELYIGVPYKNGDQYVDLVLSAKGPNGTASKTFSSKDLEKLDGQNADLRFYHYSASPLVNLSGKEVGYWVADPTNSLTAQTVALGLITSKAVTIDKSGIWFVNVAESDGGEASVSHSYCYTYSGNTEEASA